MKSRSSIVVLGILIFAVLLFTIGTYSAQNWKVVNVDFEHGTHTTYSGTAAAPDEGTYWNSVVGARDEDGKWLFSEELLDSRENSTSVQVKFTIQGYFENEGPAGWPPGSGPVIGRLLADYVYTYTPNKETEDFVIFGLAPNGVYDLYLYGNEEVRTRGGGWKIDGVTKTTTGLSSADGLPEKRYVEGVTYVVFKDLKANANGEIVGTYFGELYGIFNGFQIVNKN